MIQSDNENWWGWGGRWIINSFLQSTCQDTRLKSGQVSSLECIYKSEFREWTHFFISYFFTFFMPGFLPRWIHQRFAILQIFFQHIGFSHLHTSFDDFFQPLNFFSIFFRKRKIHMQRCGLHRGSLAIRDLRNELIADFFFKRFNALWSLPIALFEEWKFVIHNL